jgi:FKBP-type peptidyl-prolyl cis-trans isomerase FklB
VRKLLALLGAGGLAASAFAGEESQLKSLKEKISYCIGLNIGKGMKQEQVDIDLDTLLRGLKDGLSGARASMAEEEIKDTLMTFQKDMEAKQEARLKADADKAQKEGEAFLAENKKKEGVKTLASGLQYKVIKAGTGKVSPKAADTVVTHYRGTLVDGTEFDSSIQRGKPAEFEVSKVIPAWTEALQLMKVGDKWQLVVPSALAYGERGAGRAIPPNATLIFEVELLEIKDATETKEK